ncbi:MAG: M4 family metallopeptidase, partial [Oligoflexia bacterium]|nr:M4 family metallopeptidase [Oligoflexia bacterium]
DFASSLDVVAHELTHALTSSTSNLQYVSESGALNESYSDIFGKLVAFKYGNPQKDWKLGKELFKDGKRFIRDMENPEVGHVRDFKYKGQFCNRMNDFCGVHTNSGIPNKVAVLITNSLGEEKIGKLYYMVLTQMLRTNSDFKEARAQTVEACKRLFRGGSSQECQAVAAAYSEVGIE